MLTRALATSFAPHAAGNIGEMALAIAWRGVSMICPVEKGAHDRMPGHGLLHGLLAWGSVLSGRWDIPSSEPSKPCCELMLPM